MKRSYIVWILVVVLAASAGLLLGCGDQPGTVEGTVVRMPGAEPLGGATVAVYELAKAKEVSEMDVYQKGVLLYRELADQEGRFSISLLPGPYQVQIWVDGVEREERLVKIEPGRVTTVHFEIEDTTP